MKYDIGIIGAGIAGLTAALDARSKGLKVVLFEKRNLGGLSFNGGDILVRKMFETIEEYLVIKKHQVDSDSSVHLGEIINILIEGREKSITEYMRLFQGKEKFKIVYEEAKVIDRHKIVAGGEEYEVDNVILAYGSISRNPSAKGAAKALEDNFLIKSYQLTKVDPNIKRVAILGSGRSAFELAIFLAVIGIDVYIMARNGFLNHLDNDIKDIYLSLIKSKELHLIDKVKIEEFKDKTIYYKKDGVNESLAVDVGIVAMGFVPNYEVIKNLDIVKTEHGLLVNEYCETSISGIYAIGDANHQEKFSSLAISEAVTAVNHIVGNKIPITYDNVVKSVFGTFSYAYFGFNEKELIPQNIPYIVKVLYPKRDLGGENDLDYVKLILHRYTNQILGIYIVGKKVINEINAILSIVNSPTHSSFKNRYPVFSSSHYIGQLINNYLKENNFNIINEHFESFYQPKYNINDNTIMGVESLARFKFEDKVLNPLPFIEMFEQNEMILDLDLKVIENACGLINELKEKGILEPNFKVSVNIAPQTLHTLNPNNIDKIIDKYKIDKKHLMFEVTERANHSLDLVSIIKEFKAEGYLVSMDDFSIGNASLPLLKKAKLDEVKIDRELLPLDKDDTITELMFKNIVSILKTLELDIISEGIETEYQLALLKEVGIKGAQGYYLNRPMSKDNLLDLIGSK